MLPDAVDTPTRDGESSLYREKIASGGAGTNRAALMDALTARFHQDEQATLVDNGLSTYVMIFPSDLHPRNAQRRNEKIKRAMDYATTFKDVEELNALHRIPNTPVEPDYYATLGLYLYFADECSRLKPDTTFLSELRKVEAGLDPNKETFESSDLVEKFHKALANLGMEESHGPILDEWAKYGSYTIQGEWNGRDSRTGDLKGAYARLARDICKQKKYLVMNLPVSYALGNKAHIENMSAEEAYRFTGTLTHPEYTALDPRVAERIRAGDEERLKTMNDAIDRQTHAVEARSQSAEARHSAGKLLSYLPDDMLELLYLKGYDIAYSNAPTIEKCYPKEKVPGENAGKAAFEDKGVNEERFQTIFISNGYRAHNGGDLKDDEVRYQVAAQNLAHEGFHTAIDLMSPAEQAELKKAVDEVRRELVTRERRHEPLPAYLSDYLKTIDGKKLGDVIDYSDAGYAYARKRTWTKGSPLRTDSDDRWKEVACNVYSLMQTEYKPGAAKDPYSDLPSLGALKKQIDYTMKTALNYASEGTARDVELPQTARGRA